MNAWLLAAWLLAPAGAGRAPQDSAPPARLQEPSPEASRLKAEVREDQKAVRRARYALRKAEGTPQEEPARQRLSEAKATLKARRLELKALRGRLRRP